MDHLVNLRHPGSSLHPGKGVADFLKVVYKFIGCVKLIEVTPQRYFLSFPLRYIIAPSHLAKASSYMFSLSSSSSPSSSSPRSSMLDRWWSEVAIWRGGSTSALYCLEFRENKWMNLSKRFYGRLPKILFFILLFNLMISKKIVVSL